MRNNSVFLFTVAIILITGCTNYQRTNLAKSPEQVAGADIDGEIWARENGNNSPLKGWDFLASKLRQKGLPENEIINIFSSDEMPKWTPIPFKVRPKESAAMYRNINSKQAQKNALQFYNQHKKHFFRARDKYGVDPQIILSILQIETQCGKNTGNEPIFYWLARLVSTGFPPNLAYNFRKSEETPTPSYRELEERAEWLEEEFMPHLISLIETSRTLGVSPMSIKGSKGGAIGLPQFLPGNIKKFGVDGDGNGAINLFVPADAIFSVGKFLESHGWKKGMNTSLQRKVILEYNRSSAYANTVLEMSKALKSKL